VQSDDQVLGLEAVWKLVLRSVLPVEGALVLATLIVPVLGVDRDPDDQPPVRSMRGMSDH